MSLAVRNWSSNLVLNQKAIACNVSALIPSGGGELSSSLGPDLVGIPRLGPPSSRRQRGPRGRQPSWPRLDPSNSSSRIPLRGRIVRLSKSVTRHG